MRKSTALRWRVGLIVSVLAIWNVASSALFTNGGFEAGTLTGWTTTSYYNASGLSGSPPYGAANLNLTSGGSNRTKVVGSPGGGPLSLTDVRLGASASLRVPRFGNYAAVVNETGDNNNVNSLKQSTIVQASDIDPLDGQVHVRLAYAPVLENPNHAAEEQPWFFLVVRNKSRGNAVLFEKFAYANQPGVPWKTGASSTLYTDWQVVDVAPGNAQLAVGDQIELEAIAAGCSAGGHAGWVYVDAFGSLIPGPSVVAQAQTLVNPSSPLTYTLTARNQGTGALGDGVITFAVPANTTFATVSDTTACSHSAGVVTCNIGTLAVDAIYEAQVTVNVGAVGNGTVIAAGNYSIAGTGEPALLGPLVNTTVTSASLVDLAVTVDDGETQVFNGQSRTYTIVASNLSNVPVTGASVTATLPAALTGATWTCAATGSSTCTPSGSGSIADTVSLEALGSVTYTLTGTVAGLTGTLSVPVSITAPGGTTDLRLSNNSAADNDVFPPVANADAYSVTEDTPLTVTTGGVLANDIDTGGTLTAALVSNPAHGTLVLGTNGTFTYTPVANYFGTDSFVYRASDGVNMSAPATVTLTVTGVNDAPTLDQPGNLPLLWDASAQTITLTGITAGPGESELVTITAVSGAPGTVVVGPVNYGGGTTASFTVTPVPLQQGSAVVTVTVSDGSLSTTRTFTVMVSPPALPPVATADAYSVNEDATLVVTAGQGVLANDTDVNGDPMTATLVTSPAHGTLVLAPDGGFTYTPAADYFGSDSFAYQASDGTSSSAPVTVSLTVTSVNDAPAANLLTDLSFPWNASAQTVTVTGLSAGPGETDPLTVTAVSSVPGTMAVGPVTYGGGATASFAVVPVKGQQGTVTVSVVVSDGIASVTRTFTVNVTVPPFYVTHVYPATGPAPGGTHIRIYGTGFTLPGNAVSAAVVINGVPAMTTIVESDGVVSAVTPPLPAGQPLDVQLIVPAGTGTLPHAYTPYDRPKPNEPTPDPSSGSKDPAPQTPPDPTNPMDPTAPTVDSDGDGIPDVWEEFYGLDPFDPTDATADPDGDGKSNFEEFKANSHPDGRQARYFAEGNAQQPFRTWVNFYNPAPIEAVVNMTFFLDDATVVKHLVKSPAGARLTVDSATIPGLQNHAFGMRIEADESVVINRTITWNDQGFGATAERAVDLSKTWYFAEGATHEHLQTFLLLANPSDADIVADVEYLISSVGRRATRTHIVPAHSRLTVWVNQEGPELANEGFGTVVRASAPLVAERATYFVDGPTFQAGETSVGSPGASTEWYFAEGSSGPFFDTFLLLANPTENVAQVQVRYLPDHGDEVVRTHVVGPLSRVTVPINNEAAWDGWTGMGMHVTSTNGVEIVAERAMWWSTDDHASWEEGHGSGGLTAPATSFAIGDGIAGGVQGAATYLLLVNPAATDATVRITLGFEDGTAPVSQDVTVPAGRRVSLDLATTFPTADGRRFSARIDSVNATPIVVEQSIYWTLGSGVWRTGVSLPATRLQ